MMKKLVAVEKLNVHEAAKYLRQVSCISKTTRA
jgi:hypothetical protein